MMNYNYNINLSHLLGPNYHNYGAILAEKHPQVVYQKGHNGLQIISYLWYPIELGQIPNTFTKYFQEKLAVTDPTEAKQMIHDWNIKYLPTAPVLKQFNIGKKRFSVIKDPNNIDQLIVLANYADRPAGFNEVKAGSGGYIWQKLPNSNLTDDLTTHGVLKTKFNLRLKVERDRFIDLW